MGHVVFGHDTQVEYCAVNLDDHMKHDYSICNIYMNSFYANYYGNRNSGHSYYLLSPTSIKFNI